jgi:hypothetical protein
VRQWIVVPLGWGLMGLAHLGRWQVKPTSFEMGVELGLLKQVRAVVSHPLHCSACLTHAKYIVLLIFYSVERSINLTNTANFIVSLVWYF